MEPKQTLRVIRLGAVTIQPKELEFVSNTYGNPEGAFPFRYLSEKKLKQGNWNGNQNKKYISFNGLVISFKRYNKSLKRYKIEWKFKQQNGN